MQIVSLVQLDLDMIMKESIPFLALLLRFMTDITKAASYRARSCAGTIRHVHLSVGHDPSSEMTVSFSSVRSFHVHQIGGVLIGTKPDELNVYIEEQEPARYYNATPLRERHGHYYSPLNHHIRITDLDPSVTYYYKCTVRKPHKEAPFPNSGSGAALRGSITTRSAHYDSDLQFEDEVMRAEEREDVITDDDATEVGYDGDPWHRRLDRDYYDSTLGKCPPPNKIRSFQTAPPAGHLDDTKISKSTEEPTLKFAYIGDIGQFDHTQENIKHLVNHQGSHLNAIILAGDIAYPTYDNRRWDTFFDFLDDFFIVDEVPLQVVAGNHDIDKQVNGSDIFLAYETRFHMPQVKPAELGTYDGPEGRLNMDAPPYPLPYEYGNAYYAFTYGITHQIFLNAYSSMEKDSVQYQWLVKELQQVDRSVTPWLLVTFHVPLYNAFDVHHHDLQIVAAKEHIEPLLVQYRANLVVAGHIHAYSRTENVNMDQLDPTGPMHVVVGAGGRQSMASFRSEVAEPYIAVRDATRYGYGTLEIFNETHARWDWIVTGYSEYQGLNTVWESNLTLPRMEHSDSVIFANQYLI